MVQYHIVIELRFGRSALPNLPYTHNVGALYILHGRYSSRWDASVHDDQGMPRGAGASSNASLKCNLQAGSLKTLRGYQDLSLIHI